jgi:hypothetical protein
MRRLPLSPGDNYDSLVRITDYELVNRLGDLALLGNWFAFLKPEWLERSGMDTLLESSGIGQAVPKPSIIFRGRKFSLPGATLEEKPLPALKLLSLTSDKALYRANRDTVRLLLAAPRRPGAEVKLSLRLSGNPYAEYPVTLDEYGLALWSMQDLPEGEYEARIEDSAPCRFEVAEYRLAALNAELVDQSLQGEVLHYTLSVTAFGQPYSGPVEIELQERGLRVGPRVKRQCDEQGRCHGVVKLTGAGPYTLNVLAGERSATVALKGSEQERRETLTISELGEIHEISLLPLPDAQEWRGISVARTGKNTEPFLVSQVIGKELELVPRVAVEMLRAVVIDPVSSTYTEQVYEQISAGQSLRLPITAPYGVVLLGAFLDGKAWEGWCAILRPGELELRCEAPTQARPGQRITVTLKTGAPGRSVPMQLIVKDQRLIALSDPQVELAACIKKDLTSWHASTHTGDVERQVAQTGGFYPFGMVQSAAALPMSAPLPPPAPAPGAPTMLFRASAAPPRAGGAFRGGVRERAIAYGAPAADTAAQEGGVATAAPNAALTRVRMEFPEVIYNNLLKVEGETSIEIKLGDSMTRYTVEAFALDPAALDWQRVETTVEAIQPVYGELTVSPFVFPGDPVMGRLDVGASSGSALAEVRHNEELLPLFSETGDELPPGQPVPSGSVLRFPAKPGALTAIVRDAQTGEADASERYITEPGKLRHIMRRLRLLTPGEEVTLQEEHALALKPMPGLERPFQFFVEGAAKYPFG